MGEPVTRVQLARELAQLDAEVPEMKRRFFEPDSFIGQFAVRAEMICAAAGRDDTDWVLDQLSAILSRRSMVDEYDAF